MKMNLEYIRWRELFQFPLVSLDTETLELDDGLDNENTLVIDPDNLDQIIDLYSLDFISKYQLKLRVDIATFTVDQQRMTVIFWTTNTIPQKTVPEMDKYGNISVAHLPEYLIVANKEYVKTYKLFTRYQDTYYYKGKLFGDDLRYWISYDCFFDTILSNFTNDFLLDLIDHLIQPFVSDKLHVLYNFISSNFRDESSNNLLVPPVEPSIMNRNPLLKNKG